MQAQALRSLHNNDAKKHQVDARHRGAGCELVNA
jgi:hypothetical protein